MGIVGFSDFFFFIAGVFWRKCVECQLISKANFDVFKSPKNQHIFVRISALASKMDKKKIIKTIY